MKEGATAGRLGMGLGSLSGAICFLVLMSCTPTLGHHAPVLLSQPVPFTPQGSQLRLGCKTARARERAETSTLELAFGKARPSECNRDALKAFP